MKLDKKKELAAKVLKVGKARIIFVKGSEEQIKEAITRQDIVDLKEAGAIKIREVKGRKTNVKRKHRRGMGKVKKRVNKKKQIYVKLTRKLRKVLGGMKRMGKIDNEKYRNARKMIKASRFKSKRHMHDSVEEM